MLFRSILLAREDEARFSLFCDASIEEVYRLSRKREIPPYLWTPPDEELRQYAEGLRRNDLHGLTGLYLCGRPVKSLWEEKW